ncbi:MAG: hypothetical protein HN764_03575 [Gammaproteobacteria bacterium]|nr:hypothetical protein [Gammaproteobacteria bacterium]
MAIKYKLEDMRPTGVACSACRKGTLEPARGRYGPIYRCSAKGCNFFVESRPIGKKCKYLRDGEKCGALMVEGTQTIPDRCSDKSCPNRNPHKLEK